MLDKPPHGAPCNGCGGCCVAQRCPLGTHVFGAGGNCPALEVAFPAFTCGLIQNPAKYAVDITARHGSDAASRAAEILIGAGLGCDALLEGEQPNLAWRARVRAGIDRAEADAAAAIWNLRRFRKGRSDA